jgi:uncharacterized protein with PIN domain
MTVSITEDRDLVPRCPHCEAELSEIVATTAGTIGSSQFRFGKRYVYACPSCRRALGVSHRKGFWAG